MHRYPQGRNNLFKILHEFCDDFYACTGKDEVFELVLDAKKFEVVNQGWVNIMHFKS